MSDVDNIGKLMYLPVENIQTGEQFSASEFLVNAAAEAVLKAGGRNWLPLIVKEIAEYQYQVVSNPLVYAVAEKAKLERVWCIIIDNKPEAIEQVRIFTGEAIPRVNLNTASEETIQAALRYLTIQPGSLLKETEAIKAIPKIANANRETWENFDEVRKLKSVITAKRVDVLIDALKQVFFFEPLPQIVIPPTPEIVSIKRASREEIFVRLNYLSTYKIGGFAKIDPDKTADIIFMAVKTKWKSLNPISTLECGISTPQIKTLKTVFKV